MEDTSCLTLQGNYGQQQQAPETSCAIKCGCCGALSAWDPLQAAWQGETAGKNLLCANGNGCK